MLYLQQCFRYHNIYIPNELLQIILNYKPLSLDFSYFGLLTKHDNISDHYRKINIDYDPIDYNPVKYDGVSYFGLCLSGTIAYLLAHNCMIPEYRQELLDSKNDIT